MAEQKKEVTGFYLDNTVEIEINGVKRRVNKEEAKLLADKLKKEAKK